MATTIDHTQLIADVEAGEVVPVSWDTTYGAFLSVKDNIGDKEMGGDTREEFRSDLWRVSQQARLLARLADALYSVAQRDADDAEEETAAPEPPEEPAHVVDVFWTLAQHFQRTGVNVEQVARDAVASMTPAT